MTSTGTTTYSTTVPVQENDTGDLFIELPQETLDAAGFKAGDQLKWSDNGDGSWSITRTSTMLVLVECVSTFRQRYMVEVPRGRSDWALDTVSMNEAVEFSQKHLGETIVSHRVVPRTEALALCRQDNDYVAGWTDEQLIKTFFTPDKE